MDKRLKEDARQRFGLTFSTLSAWRWWALEMCPTVPVTVPTRGCN
jgi:hypothetical protein